MGLSFLASKEKAEATLAVRKAEGYSSVVSFRNAGQFSLPDMLRSCFLLRLDLITGLKMMMRANGYSKEFPDNSYFPKVLGEEVSKS